MLISESKRLNHIRRQGGHFRPALTTIIIENIYRSVMYGSVFISAVNMTSLRTEEHTSPITGNEEIVFPRWVNPQQLKQVKKKSNSFSLSSSSVASMKLLLESRILDDNE